MINEKTSFRRQVEEEYKNIRMELFRGASELELYPKGTIHKKKIQKKEYPYLVYRENGKPKTQYLSRKKGKYEKVAEKVKERDAFIERLNKLNRQRIELEYTLSYGKWHYDKTLFKKEFVHGEEYDIEGLFWKEDGHYHVSVVINGTTYVRKLDEISRIPRLAVYDYAWMQLEELYEDTMLELY